MKRLLLYLAILFLFFLGNCSGDSEKNAIKVMTLNIRYDNSHDSLNAWPQRASIVCNFVKNEKPDLLGMQEVLLQQYDLLDSVLLNYSSVGVGRIDGAKAGEMDPVFFRKDRFDMTRTKTFWLSETPEVPGTLAWGSSLPRIVTWMELVDKKTHQHFFYFNTHFAHDSDSARIMSSKLLLVKVDSIASGFPFIITGDFNMLPTSKSYAILTGPAESVPLLKDSFFISEKNPAGPMYTFNGFSDKQGPGRIDFIFVKDGLKVLDHKTIIKKEHQIYISDHWPVEAVISLK
jgi:endonuclease/exonuclease/phosphatase family metal-dependent hydrolase